MNIQTALNQANQKIKKNNIFSYKLDSEILMSKVIKEERDYVILNLNKHLSSSQLINYRKLICERSRGKPIGYLIGKKEFWKYEFYIEEKKKLIKTPHQINSNIKNLIKKNYSIEFSDAKTKLSHQEIFVSFIEIKLFNSHDFKKLEKKLDLFGANKKKLNMIAKPKVINEYLKKIS